MKTRLFVIILTLLLLPSTQHAQVNKCGIDTRALIAEQVKGGQTSVRMLVKVASLTDIPELEKVGIVVGTRAGNIVTATVPVALLSALDTMKQVVQYSVSHRVAAPNCEHTIVDTRTDSVHNGLGVQNAMSYTGSGVYVGVTDWGFDYGHINYNSYGASNWRIDRVWDHFRKAGPAPQDYDYGTEISGHANLISARGDTSNLYDYGTHGTHVTGIAAGRGVDGRYVGQSPGARLLLCSFGLGEAEWLDAVGWMQRVARDSCRRLVVNSSWGMYTFSCIDGKSLLSEAINNMSDEGVVFCTSAGNNGNKNFHVSKTFEQGNTDTLRTVASYFNSSEGVGQALIMWGSEGTDFSAGFAMASGGDEWRSPMFNTAMGDTVVIDTLHIDTISIPYRALIEHVNPFDNRPHIQMDVAKSTSHQLQLYIASDSGTVHAWNVANKQNHAGNEGCEFSRGGRSDFAQGDNKYGIGEPACAEKAISVAAHMADRWNSTQTRYSTGDLAGFSSWGPLIDGHQKPDISAPGVQVVSSISRWTTSQYTTVHRELFGDDYHRWASMDGTSMSSPAVTGVVALMLEACPTLSVDTLRQIIKHSARNDDKTGLLVATDSASVRWGWGKIDALKAINESLNHVGIKLAESLGLPLHIYPNPSSNSVTINTNCGEKQLLQIYSVDGRCVYRADVSKETMVDVSDFARGIYVVQVGNRVNKLVVK
ncbi:MAG: S8 family peptidase [Bacteroidales bacterium]|nr:S8 family peptidase [Bacteroidales bacterium]